MKTPRGEAPSSSYRAQIEALPEEGFRGETQFSTMTPTQRLQWLDQAVNFIIQARALHSDPGVIRRGHDLLR